MSTGQRVGAEEGKARRLYHREMTTNAQWPHRKRFNLTTTIVVKYCNHLEVAVLSQKPLAIFY